MTIKFSILRSITISLMVVFFSSTPLMASVLYVPTIDYVWNRSATGSTGWTAGVAGNYIFRVGTTSSRTAKPRYWWITNGSSSANTEYYGETGWISEGAITQDENNYIVFCQPYVAGGIMRCFTYYSNKDGSLTKKGFIQINGNNAWSYYDTNEWNTTHNAKSARVTGTMGSNGHIWICPKGQKYIYEIVTSGTSVSSVNKYSISVTNGEYATACAYASGKLYYSTGSAGYLGTYSGSGSSGTTSLTKISVTGFNHARSAGTVVWVQDGRTLMMGACSSGGTTALWDMTKDNGHLYEAFTTFSPSVTPYQWFNVNYKNSTEHTKYIFGYFKEKGGARYNVTTSAAVVTCAISYTGNVYDGYTVTITGSQNSKINPTVTTRYTTNGNNPTKTSGTTYSSSISITSPCTLKAISYLANYDNDASAVASQTFSFKCRTPTISGVANGASIIANSQALTFACATSGATIQYSLDNSTWTNASSYTFTGLGAKTIYVRATKSGYTTSDVATLTFTLRKPAAPTISGTSPFDNSTTVTMAAGADGGTIYYTSGSSTPADPTTSSTPYTSGIDISSTTYFKAICVVNGVASDVTSATFTRNEALAAPTIMPTSNTYNNDLTATITAASGATIYYRVNGGAWQTYSTGISVTANNTTIEAYATKAGNSDSPIASQTYNFTCLTPTASPAAGIYNSVQSVTLSCGTTGATIHYTTDGSTPNSSSPVYSSAINVSTSMTIKAIAIKSGYTDSDVLTAEYVLNLNPSSNVTSPVLTSTPKYGTSVNNPDRDLARLDGNLTFSAADPTSNGWTLDKYVVTISDGTNYATTVSGANINAIEFGTESTTITACNFKVGSTYTATVFARYKKGEATYDMPVVSSDAVDFSFDTYSPTIAVTTYVTPRQGQYVWWEDEHEQHLCYFDSYRVELTIDDHPLYSPTNSVPVSYYELLVSKDKGKNWEVITDRTVNNLLDPTNYPATTYPEGQYSGVVDKDKYVGRYNGNYRFSDSKNKITMDAGTENEREINLWFYYVYDVTSKVGTLSITDDSQGDPSKWQYRINAVYGGSESVTVDGTTITPTTDNISTTDYSDAIQSEGSIIITGVDGVAVDRNVKEIRFFDMRGVRLNEAPSSGFYIEVKLMNDGSIRTNKRVAR